MRPGRRRQPVAAIEARTCVTWRKWGKSHEGNAETRNAPRSHQRLVPTTFQRSGAVQRLRQAI